ncbi:MAG: Peptidase propeptide and protein [Belnapia sp.]|nr:Peptidase propeptide and protein [Belnapia sp.]
MPRIPAASLAFALAVAALPLAAMAAPDAAEQQAIAAAAVDAGAAVAAVRNAGYGAVRDLEWERGAWEVKATDATGRSIELRVDATTGAVSRRDR